MLKYYNYDIVFQEIPDEVTLAINITNCPNRCKGCHSPHLQQDIGEYLDKEVIDNLISKYGSSITCFCFMGGDRYPHQVANLAKYIRCTYSQLKTAWYSGCEQLPVEFEKSHFQYIKLGGYIEERGDLRNKNSNQHIYELHNGKMIDISYKFRHI
ncbi:MAG: anaerobic ribonucleoside-triphosphate reductase activating protein [Paludibacteraceae bacterium]|nr:anaerobic ribonucleoside-triphosphate reductase activating protein [Paludibacteraceae bacterium]